MRRWAGSSSRRAPSRGDAGGYGAEISYYVPEDVAEALAEAARAEREAEEAEEAEEGEEERPAAIAAVRPGGMMAAASGPGAREGGAQASIAILDGAGDTVQVLNGSASAGIQRVRWTFNRRTVPEPPSPADRADSLRRVRLYETVGDSLVEHEGVERETMDQVLGMLQGGNQAGLRRMFGGGGGGGFGGDPDAWRERPAERYPQAGQGAGRGGGRGGAGAGQGAGGGADPASMQAVFMQVNAAMRERGGGGGFRRFFGGGGGGGGLADPGTYTVNITVGEETYTTTLEVVRKEGFGFWDEPDKEGGR